jgi:hypothetical protein
MPDYTLTQAAGYLGKSRHQLVVLMARELLTPDYTIGRSLMFKQATLDALSLRQGWTIGADEITVQEMLELSGLSDVTLRKRLFKHDIKPIKPRRGSIPARYSRKEVYAKFLNQILDIE